MMLLTKIKKSISVVGGVLISAFLSFAIVFAQAVPDAFIVEVDPSSFGLNAPVDLVIKAVNNAGETMADYEGDVFIELLWVIDPDDYVVPSDGLYTFLSQDQWVKLFSKGLNVKIPGTFTIAVSDIIDETIQGKATVIVWTQQVTEEKAVAVVSPLPGSVESANVIEVLAQAPDLPNSSYQILLNDRIVEQWISTEKWDIAGSVQWATVWQNTVQIKVVDINGLVIGESPLISFKYQTTTDSMFNGIEILPSSTIKQWDKVIFNVKTNEGVWSVELRLSNGQAFPMDLGATLGQFVKQIPVSTLGTIMVSLSLSAWGNVKTYNDIASFIVEESFGVGTLRFYGDGVDKTKMTVSWDSFGEIAKYRVEYGIQQSSLNLTQETNQKEIVLENLNPEWTYYIRVVPLNAAGVAAGNPSGVEQVQPWHLGASSEWANCVVQWIAVTTGQIWNKYYLMWDAVDNVSKYVVYRSDWETNNLSEMRKVWESTDNTFEYPFNLVTRQDEYAYYAVQAICTDGNVIQIDNVKKVHVWPMDNLLLVVIVSLFFYVIFSLYKNTNEA